MTLVEQLEAKRSELDELANLAETEKRELNEDEKSKFDGLEIECRNLKEKIDAEEAERKEKDEADKLEAERQAKETADKEEAERKAKEEADTAEAERAAKEKEAELENLRSEKEELQKTLDAEREAKEALETKLEDNKRSLEQEQENKRQMADENKQTIYDVVREASNEGLRSETITVKRAAADGDTSAMAKGIPLEVKEIDRVGKKPVWEMMGLDIMRGAKGTYMLPHETPRIGEKLAELASVTKDAVSPDGVLVQPGRYSKQKEFTYETINSATDAFIQSIINDLRVSIDRAKTADVYAKALAGATAVTSVTGLDRDNFIDLMAAVEVDEDGSFLSARSTYFKSMKVAIDAGSGKFLSTSVDANGETKTYVTETGASYWYNSLFANPTGEEYVVYGDLSKIHFADYDTEKVIIDPYTKAGEGKVIITVVSLAGIVLKNPDAFAKSTDLLA